MLRTFDISTLDLLPTQQSLSEGMSHYVVTLCKLIRSADKPSLLPEDKRSISENVTH